MKEFYADIVQKLENLVLDGELSAFSYVEMRGMTNKVVQNLAKNYKNIREGVGNIMGGKVLVTEISRVRDKARSEMAVELVENMLRSGMKPEEIANACKLALSDIKIVQERMMQIH